MAYCISLFFLAAFLIWSGPKSFAFDLPHSCLASSNTSVEAPTRRVMEVIDGDTLILSDGSTVRLHSIRAPKHHLTKTTMAPAPYSKISRNRLKQLVTENNIVAVLSSETEDRYGRLHAHILVAKPGAQPFWLQEALVREGMVRVQIPANNPTCAKPLLALEAEARRTEQGLWASSYFRVRQHDDLAALMGTFQLVEGSVVAVAQRRNRVFINFGEDWREDFTITIPPKYARSFLENLDPETLIGRKVRVRGWVENYNGPFIEAAHPHQIEILGEKPQITPF